MSKGKNQHVVKHPDGWAVKDAGNSKATKVTRTQQEAMDVAEQIAKNQQSDKKVHGRTCTYAHNAVVFNVFNSGFSYGQFFCVLIHRYSPVGFVRV